MKFIVNYIMILAIIVSALLKVTSAMLNHIKSTHDTVFFFSNANFLTHNLKSDFNKFKSAIFD